MELRIGIQEGFLDKQRIMKMLVSYVFSDV